jgi:hypothetical protein
MNGIAQECNVDYALQKTTIVRAQTHISLIGHRKHMYLFGSNKDGNYPTFQNFEIHHQH